MNSSTPPALTVQLTPPVSPADPAPTVPPVMPVVTTPITPVPPESVTPELEIPTTPPPSPVVTAPETPPTVQPTAPVIRATCSSAGSDSDGDGYGWENNDTCLVASSSAPVPTPATPSTPVPVCALTASDSDGDGYGWENNSTCLISGSSVPPAIAATSQAPEPVQPPQAAPVQAAPLQTPPPAVAASQPSSNQTVTAADITDLILVTGQSNALGAGTGYDASLDDSNSRVFAFTNEGWQVADLRQIWDRRWHPRNDPSTDPSNNFSLHFGKSVAARDSSRVIGFILATAPGAKIDNWEQGTDFYSTVQNKTLDAINQLPHKSSIDGVLWHQGESDGEDKQYYTDALYSLIFNLRNEPWVKPDAPFICGETKIESVNNRLNGLNRDSDPNTACVRAIDLPTLGDNRHFNAAALRTIGARYADAYLRITR